MKTTVRLFAIGLFFVGSSIVNGQVSNPVADASIKAFNDAFLMTSGGRTFYKNKLNSTEHDGTWTLALDIFGMQDTYERTGSVVHKALVNSLCSGFLLFNPTPYNWDGWNDDLAWMGLVMARGYQVTGTSGLLAGAEHSFYLAYNRGWNTIFNDGGIWEQQPDMTPVDGSINKEALSNNPNGNLACLLYQSTGNVSYLNKAIQIYNWSRSHLFNPDNGQVYANIDRFDVQNRSTAVYNQGSFIDFAATLYKLTGKEIMLRDAQMAADYVIKNMTSNGIISNDADYLDTWADTYARGVGHLCMWNPQLWNTYYPFLKKNADAAWANRRTDLNISWNAWNKPTPIDATPKTTKFVSSVALMQFTPVVQALPSTIEAENYNFMKGVTTGSISIDNKNMESIETGDWMEYIVQVPTSGVYTILLTVAGTTGGTVSLQQNNITLITLELPNTPDTNTYTIIGTSVNLSAGIQSIKFLADKGGWIFDKWMAQKSPIVSNVSINDGVQQQKTAVTLNVGDQITFNPQPTDGVWSWTGPNNFSFNGRTTTISNIQYNQGGVYTAKYTSPEGIASMQEYTVSLNGCSSDPITTNVKINDGAYQEMSSIKAAAGCFVTIAPTAMDGTWSWTGPNGFSSSSRVVSFLSTTYKQAGDYTVTYTNMSGCKSTKIVKLSLYGSDPYSTPIDFYSQLNNGEWKQGSYALLSTGGTITIGPHPIDPGEWKWTGPANFVSNTREITIRNFNETKVGRYTATFTNAAGSRSTGEFILGMKGSSSTSIVPEIKVNGLTWSNASSITLKSGGSVSITPPDIEGSWNWTGPNGFKVNSRQLIFNKMLRWKEGRYVVSRIDSNSSISTHTIDILVTGDDYAGTPIIPYVNIAGAWKQQTTASVKSGVTISFGPQPGSGSWRWKGPNEFTSNDRAFTLSAITVAQAGVYRATLTNSSGCESYKDFQVTVDGISDLKEASDETPALVLYPNPAKDQVTLKNVPANSLIAILDLSGRTVWQMQSSFKTENTTIHIGHLKAGIYFVKVGNGSSKTLKLLKK